ncbi:MAG: sulfurtransferase-like selenium metabolism protein YedF [Thermodesulfobacteriota bacterium]
MKEIDARGLACPAPVLQTKAVLEEDHPDKVNVTVDNAAAQQNVQRFLESQGFETTLDQSGNDYFIVGSCGPLRAAAPETDIELDKGDQKIMVMCATDRMGSGDDELGRKLMISYLRTLEEMGGDLWRLVFVNNGVKLTIDGSEVVADLKKYEKQGIKILVCGTCLTHFDLLERKQVGITTNMLDIVTAMQNADKVISI